MKKSLVIVAFLLLIGLLGFVAADHEVGHIGVEIEEDDIENAYQCLRDQIDERETLSFQEGIFSTLALGNYKGSLDAIEDNKNSNQDCWPKSGCSIKETAQSLLALNRVNANTQGAEDWLLDRNGTADDLSWFLEVDISGQKESSCTITYDDRDYDLDIGSNSVLSGNAGSCLSLSSSGYLLRIRDSCLDEEFKVSCDEDFVSTLIYQKSRGENTDCLDENNITCFVSGKTSAAASLGSTSEKVNALCLKSGGRCDYEGTLWAALALSKSGNSVSDFIPYLLALSEDNSRYFPDAFLSVLIGDDESFDNVIQERKQGQFWEISGSPYNRFYDTSLGMLGLGVSGDLELDASRDYLVEIQTEDGCWNNNNIRDTGFLLYSGWGRTVASAGGGGGSSSAFCEEAGFSCERFSECQGIGGVVHDNFECTGIGVCCSLEVPKVSCEAEGGVTCGAGSQCDGRTFESSGGQACCLGACLPVQAENACEDRGGTCRFSCGDGEETTSHSCGFDTGSVCCQQERKSSGGSGGLITILVILIIIAALGIMFRHKIQVWWHSRKGGKLKSKPVTKRPGPPGSGMARMMRGGISPTRRVPVRSAPARSRPAAPKRDSELDETLKKLRDMSK